MSDGRTEIRACSEPCSPPSPRTVLCDVPPPPLPPHEHGGAEGRALRLPSSSPALPPPPLPPPDSDTPLARQRLQRAEEAVAALEGAVRALTALAGTPAPPAGTAAAPLRALADLLHRAALLANTAGETAERALCGICTSFATTSSVNTSSVNTASSNTSSASASPSPSNVSACVPYPLRHAAGAGRSRSLRATVVRPARVRGGAGDAPVPAAAPPTLKSEPDSLSVAVAVAHAQAACTAADITQALAPGRYTACVPLPPAGTALPCDPVCRTLTLHANASKAAQQQQQQQQQQQRREEDAVLRGRCDDAGEAPVTASLMHRGFAEAAQKTSSSTTKEAATTTKRTTTEAGKARAPLEFGVCGAGAVLGGPARSTLTEELRRAEREAAARARKKYTVTLPPDYTRSAVVSLAEQATVADAIRETLRSARASASAGAGGDGAPLLDDADAYVLYLADDDGQPERDFPAAEAQRRIGEMQCYYFALAENAAYRPRSVARVWHGRDRARRSVLLPLCRTHTVGDLLRQACAKLGLRAADYELQYADLDMAFDAATRVADAGTTEFRLHRVAAPPQSAGASNAGSGSGGGGGGAGGNSSSMSHGDAAPTPAPAPAPSNSGSLTHVGAASPAVPPPPEPQTQSQSQTQNQTTGTGAGTGTGTATGEDSAAGTAVPLRATTSAHSDSFTLSPSGLLHGLGETLLRGRRTSTYNLRPVDGALAGEGDSTSAGAAAVTEANAGTLKEYRVVYHKASAGSSVLSHHRRAKVMKVDGEWITFMNATAHSRGASASDRASASSFVSDGTTSSGAPRKEKPPKNGSVLKSAVTIDNVSEVGAVAGKPGMFFLVVGSDRFEFESPARDEIVAKISTILRLRAEAASAADAAAAAADAAASASSSSNISTSSSTVDSKR